MTPKFYAYVERDFVRQRNGQHLKAKTVLGAKREASALFWIGFDGTLFIAEIVGGGLNHLAHRSVGGRFPYPRAWRACLAAEPLTLNCKVTGPSRPRRSNHAK